MDNDTKGKYLCPEGGIFQTLIYFFRRCFVKRSCREVLWKLWYQIRLCLYNRKRIVLLKRGHSGLGIIFVSHDYANINILHISDQSQFFWGKQKQLSSNVSGVRKYNTFFYNFQHDWYILKHSWTITMPGLLLCNRHNTTNSQAEWRVQFSITLTS